MSNGRNKYQTRESRRQRLREVLNEHWDPIGVACDSNPNEYDGCVGTVYVMLMDHPVSEDAKNQYLYKTATGHFGVPLCEHLAARCAKTAAFLIGLRPQFETH